MPPLPAHRALAWPLAIVVVSGNLPAVARTFRGQLPDVRLMVADDDLDRKGDLDRTKDESAA